jgi:hypothetical protein
MVAGYWTVDVTGASAVSCKISLFCRSYSMLQSTFPNETFKWVKCCTACFILLSCRWFWLQITQLISPLPTKSEGTRFALCPSVCPSNQFSALFLFMLSDIQLIFGTLLCHTKIQIKFEFNFDPSIFHGDMTLGLRKISRILSFPHLSRSCFQIFIWYLVHCFAIPRYRSSLTLVMIHWFFTKLWPLDLEKYHEFSVFRTFFVRDFDIHLRFGTLLCHTQVQIKFEFGFD